MTEFPTQRALVLQGGGALGAYEAGVFKALYENLPKTNEGNNKPLFDVIAGTSIGAINAAILVSYFKKKKSWRGSEKHLESFWQHISSDSTYTDFWNNGWNAFRAFDMNAPSKESARRYWTTREYLVSGVPKVFSALSPILDTKFLDGAMNTWYQYDNSPLQRSLKKYAQFPIATSFDNQEPRFLLTTVDVQQGKIATFDSYRTATEYGEPKIKIDYKEGIELQHVMASSSVPVHYDYTKIKPNPGSEARNFWDGGILSNTPLRELIAEHKDYWSKKIGAQALEENLYGSSDKKAIKVPDLDVFVVDLWPTKEKSVPFDRDGVIDREGDLRFHDKTHYDEKVAHIINDYIELSKKLVKLASDKGATKTEIKEVLTLPAQSQSRSENKRKYIDLLAGRFQVNVTRIKRRDDLDTVSRKWMDFSSKTISNLIKDGYQEGLKQFERR